MTTIPLFEAGCEGQPNPKLVLIVKGTYNLSNAKIRVRNVPGFAGWYSVLDFLNMSYPEPLPGFAYNEGRLCAIAINLPPNVNCEMMPIPNSNMTGNIGAYLNHYNAVVDIVQIQKPFFARKKRKTYFHNWKQSTALATARNTASTARSFKS
jgi:hypothetical protein